MLIQSDASQLEWRTLLELSKEWIGINEILGGEDTHSKNQEAFGLPSRLIAKIFLFRTIYRGSGWSFANDPDFMHVSTSSEFWDGMNEKFYAKYVSIDKKHKEWADIVVRQEPIVGPFGRSWTFPLLGSRGEFKIPWTMLTNYPVQGTGADIMMLARIMSKNRIKEQGIPCLFRSTVHDSIVLDTDEKYLEQLRDLFDSVFRDIPDTIYKLYGYKWECPLACECKYGLNFKDMKKFT